MVASRLRRGTRGPSRDPHGAKGNFVATLCRANRAGAPPCQVDIFRLEGGLIVEHWGKSEPVGPEHEWVNSGKF